MKFGNLRRALFFAAIALGAALQASAFRTDTLDITSAKGLLPQPMRVAVITPDGLAAGQKAPTVFLLNGYDGDYRQWLRIRPDLGELADRYGMVLVAPSGMDSWYWNSPVDPKMQMESFIVDELVPYVRANYPASADPALNAVTGLSMGGHGAYWLGMRHPDVWGNIGSASGGLDLRPFPGKWKTGQRLGDIVNDPARLREYTVAGNVETLKKNGQNLIFDCGSEDFFASVNAQFHQALLDAKVPHDYTSRPGVHNSKYWANSLLYQLLFFHENFKKAGDR